MFKEMRRKEKLMSEDTMGYIIIKAGFGTLACIGADGYPYSVPLNYVYENDKIYFHSAKSGQKIDHIKFQNNVCFSVVSYYKILPEKFDTEYDSVIVFGKAHCVGDASEKSQALKLLIRKYSENYLAEGTDYIQRSSNATAVYRIDIEHKTGKLGR